MGWNGIRTETGNARSILMRTVSPEICSATYATQPARCYLLWSWENEKMVLGAVSNKQTTILNVIERKSHMRQVEENLKKNG